MVDERTFEGKDLEEALERAAAGLGVRPSELHYEIVEQGRRGVFGLGARSVCIRLMPPLDEVGAVSEETPAEPEVAAPKAPDEALSMEEPAVAILRRMIELMQLDLAVTIVPSKTVGGGMTLELGGGDRKLLGERDGEVLHALQFLLNRMGRRGWPDRGKIHLTWDGQEQDRDEELIRMTREVAREVARTGRTKKLRPLNAYERRLVHLTVREFAGLSSSSDGSGALKCVRISKIHNTM